MGESEHFRYDRLETPLNACSLETLQNSPSQTRHPLIIGCYQLNEGQSSHNSEGSSRSGALILHSICMDGSNDQLKFGEAEHIIDTAGILDGKWLQSKRFHFHGDEKNDQSCQMYAAATAKGNIVLYRLVSKPGYSETIDSFQLEEVCKSLDESENGLALSLAWDEFKSCNDNDDISNSSRIVSSYSNGTIAVHEVEHHSGLNGNSTSMIETHRWNGHTLFGCPSEVWTACFANNKNYNTYTDTVLSGGDDCILKVWDLRTCSISGVRPSPVSMNKSFEAGVTAVAYHPSLEHIFAVGSYDEKIRIWDMRRVGPGVEPLAEVNVGGGVWRIKWHPTIKERILVGAMHGGCRVVMVPGLNLEEDDGTQSISIEITKDFTGHKSMAYGADWLHGHNHIEAAASCSFYDRQAFIWDTT